MSIYTTRDFETALVAKHPDGRVAAKTDPDYCTAWTYTTRDREEGHASDAEMPALGFIRRSPSPRPGSPWTRHGTSPTSSRRTP